MDYELQLESVAQAQADLCVLRGATWLDERFPGWYTRINLDTLKLSEASQCICGQVFKDHAGRVISWGDGRSLRIRNGFEAFTYTPDLYEEASVWLGIDADGDYEDKNAAELLGFDISIENDYSYRHLDNAWHDAIIERLKRDANR